MSYERPSVRATAGYVPGEQPSSPDIVKLNTNENPYPPAPEVSSALAGFEAAALRRYPHPTALEFRRAAAAVHGVDPEAIVATNGGDELLRLALDTFVDPGERIGVATPSYSLYPVLAGIHGAETVEVPLGDDWSVPADLAARLNRAGVKLTFFVNPHAPSGKLVGAGHIGELAQALDGVLLVDEAYVDFVDPELGYDTMRLVGRHDNLIILRTLSKGYSLAGLRFGYGVGALGLIRPIQTKTQDSYSMNALSQTLATAAIGAQAAAGENWARVRRDRARLREGLLALGWSVEPSQANFLLATVPADWGRAPDGGARPGAEGVYQALKARGILVRYFADARLADKLRISVGTPRENEALLARLAELHP